MTRLDNYRSAMLAVSSACAGSDLARIIDDQGEDFATFVIDHGLGPLWHDRTGRDEFHDSRMAAESLYLAQERALVEVDAAFNKAGICYAVIKGAASRLLLCKNPAIRACHDIDVLVAPTDRVAAARSLKQIGYEVSPNTTTIGHQIELSQGATFIDLHWGLLREGRLPKERVDDLIARRRRLNGIWMLAAEDTFFLLMVHPAFAKHVGGWDMGLHRVADIVDWLGTQAIDWDGAYERLQANGVKTAAWATLRWVELLTEPQVPRGLSAFVTRIDPGGLRRIYLNRWLQGDYSARTRQAHWLRQFGFSLLLHDSMSGTMRALRGRSVAHRRRHADLAEFADLVD